MGERERMNKGSLVGDILENTTTIYLPCSKRIFSLGTENFLEAFSNASCSDRPLQRRREWWETVHIQTTHTHTLRVQVLT